MADPYRIEFGAREEAERARSEFEDYLSGEPDRRTKSVEFEADAPERVFEQAMGRAAETKVERETGLPGVDLSEQEKKKIDYSEVNPIKARHAKATALEKGVTDFTSFFDPTLSLSEHEEVFEQASRETSRRVDKQESPEERFASAFKTSERDIVKHAKKGVKHGSKQAERELRQRGFSEAEIQRLKSQPAGRLDRRTEVLFPDVGKTTPQAWADTKRSHEHRRVEAQNADEGKRAQTLTTDYEEWRRNKNTMDYPGIDTPSSTDKWLDEDVQDEFNDLTRDLWTWQG